MARTSVAVAFVLFNIVIWAIAAFGLQSTSAFDGVGSQSLWSAVCDSTDQQHEFFGHEFNFGQYCLMQVQLVDTGILTALGVGIDLCWTRNWVGRIDYHIVHLCDNEDST